MLVSTEKQKTSQRRHKILLVEDDPDDAELTLRAFRKHGLDEEVLLAQDGAEALEHFFGAGEYTQGRLPSVVLLDLNLPGIDGFEVLRRLREQERTRCVPVVILTSSADQEDLLRGYRGGCNSFVRKPVDFEEFVQVAAELGVYWLQINRCLPDA